MAQSRSMPSWCDVRTRWARHKLRTTGEATEPLASPGPSGTKQLTSSADSVVPFGIRILEDGTEKTVYFDDIGKTEDVVAANYGRRCGLVCPECCQPILSVRRQHGNNENGFNCFAHAS